ncbi:MAG: RNA polymerase sigma factor [Maioricimonas sp. JB049]
MAEERDTDAQIIARSLSQTHEFGKIFERHFEAIFRFCARRIGVQEARDAASEVFERAFRLRHRFDLTRESCLPWLYGISTNVVGDRLRKSKRRRRLFRQVVRDATATFDSDSVDNRVLMESVGDQIERALSTLSKRDRDTFLLFALKELTYEEIAYAQGVPLGTVGSRINRARRKLAEQIPDLIQLLESGHPWKPDEGDAR